VIDCAGGNSMPSRLVARLRPHCRPIALIVAGMIVLQTFLAGLASARATAALAADPLGIAVICHGGGGSDDGMVPNPIKAVHLCCFDCMGGPTAATLPEQVVLLRSALSGGSTSPAICAADITIAERTVRAGQSQAPPRCG
jgi:hypothetical protein